MWCCWPRTPQPDVDLQGPPEPVRPQLASQSTLSGADLEQEFNSCLMAGQRKHMLELGHLSPEEVDGIPTSLLRRASSSVINLRLPDGCSAACLRRFVEQLPLLREITASAIVEDAHIISGFWLQGIRCFRTEPPGPASLMLPPGADVAIPRRKCIPDRIDRLEDWAIGPMPLPAISAPEWSAVRSMVLPRIEEPASRHRRGIHFSPDQLQTMLSLMRAAPQELLSGAAADNYRVVLTRLQNARKTRGFFDYAEHLFFVKPQIEAAWQVVSRIDPDGGLVRKSGSELKSLAILRLWERCASTPEECQHRADAANAWHEYLRIGAASSKALAERLSEGLRLPALPIELYQRVPRESSM